MEIEAELSRIIINETSDQQIIVIKELNGDRSFPIVIGIVEIFAIDRRLKGIELPRPMTHDLLANAIQALGGRVRAVVVHSLQKVVFHGRIDVETEHGPLELDSRPSDAIALALRVDAPIYVAESVMDESSILESDIRDIGEAGESLKDFLEIADEDSYVKV